MQSPLDAGNVAASRAASSAIVLGGDLVGIRVSKDGENPVQFLEGDVGAIAAPLLARGHVALSAVLPDPTFGGRLANIK